MKNVPIVLLDEATASLDVENESAVHAALLHLLQDKTVLIIAHRMRTGAAANKIVVLEDGRVAEQGRPPHLCKEVKLSGIWWSCIKKHRMDSAVMDQAKMKRGGRMPSLFVCNMDALFNASIRPSKP